MKYEQLKKDGKLIDSLPPWYRLQGYAKKIFRESRSDGKGKPLFEEVISSVVGPLAFSGLSAKTLGRGGTSAIFL